MFVDRVQIEVHAGNGGNGCVSFRRERYIPKGGPDGGNGGNGGSIILVAEHGVDSLSLLAHRKTWKADSGHHGQGSNCHGRGGENLVIKVPPGTVVIDAKEHFVLRDLSNPGDQIIVARGGRGGKGNTHFKSSTNRAPREFTPGEPGETRRLILELKMIADVGLVGMPNAGKSTLLSRLTRARPEIADYPFTTKSPNLGRVDVSADRSFILADIPGLIHGAHQGIGLGHDFLKHIERTRLLVHLVEPMPMDGSDPVQNYHDIRRELTEYSHELAHRSGLVVVTKCELPVAAEIHERLSREVDRPLFQISAVTGKNLNLLVNEIVRQLDAAS
jgi:GTP-binding protein